MRIGLLGGTFNPIHNGHLALAEGARKKLKLDKVIFIPTHIPPHKTSVELIDAKDRFRMINMAIRGKPGFEISRYEIEKKKKSYSVDTLEYFRRSYPKGTEFFFLIGADSLKGLDRWRDIGKLFKLCRFVVCNRRGFSKKTKYPNIGKISITPVDVSSTEIRGKIREGKRITGLLPPAVKDYIRKNNLYK